MIRNARSISGNSGKVHSKLGDPFLVNKFSGITEENCAMFVQRTKDLTYLT
jgi:hypothetical protein